MVVKTPFVAFNVDLVNTKEKSSISFVLSGLSPELKQLALECKKEAEKRIKNDYWRLNKKIQYSGSPIL